MSSCEFLNVAHAVLVEEFMRARVVRGVTIPGVDLEEALHRAKPWAEGFEEIEGEITEEQYVQEYEAAQPQQVRPQQGEGRLKTEEEMVAQNEIAMQALMGRMATISGGIRPADV